MTACSICGALNPDGIEICTCGCRVLIPLQQSDLQIRRDDAQQAMRIGVASVAGGIIFMMLTKRMAEATGFGFYLIPIGAVAYGATSFARAWRIWTKLKDVPRSEETE